jgi:hypothetical protein
VQKHVTKTASDFGELIAQGLILFGFRHKTKLHASNSAKGVILLNCSKRSLFGGTTGENLERGKQTCAVAGQC